MRSEITSERAGQVGAAVSRAVRTAGSPAATDVDALLNAAVRDRLQAGATVGEVHDALGALFAALRVQHGEPARVCVALGVPQTRARSYALECAYSGLLAWSEDEQCV
jgi:hypothetical protein